MTHYDSYLLSIPVIEEKSEGESSPLEPFSLLGQSDDVINLGQSDDVINQSGSDQSELSDSDISPDSFDSGHPQSPSRRLDDETHLDQDYLKTM